MVRLRSELLIHAPIERCFDLARDMESHVETMAHTRERIVGGRTTGLLELGDEVTFEARHFGIKQRLTSRIVQMDRPHQFTDRMVRGAFRSLEHVHAFEHAEGGTLAIDILELEAPFGFLGRIAEVVVLRPYMTRLIERRARELKRLAEA